MSKLPPSTVESRRQAVQQVRGDSALEGIRETPFMRSLSDKYISGEKTIEELIQEVREHHGLVERVESQEK
ncbi:hypothetical protein D3C85_1802050 [compost metagenome]